MDKGGIKKTILLSTFVGGGGGSANVDKGSQHVKKNLLLFGLCKNCLEFRVFDSIIFYKKKFGNFTLSRLFVCSEYL